MATATKYHCLTRDLCAKVHDFFGNVTGTGALMDDIYAALTNRAPQTSDAILADIIEIANGNGYTTGGADTLCQGSWASGVVTITATDIVWTASGSMGPFQYVVIYNNTPTSPADPLLFYYNYGSAVTLSASETFTLDFSATFITVT